MENNAMGIEFPTLDLGGKTYVVKFSGSALYRLEKLSVPVAFEKAENGGVQLKLKQMVDMLHPIINFAGTHEDLADLVMPIKQQVFDALLSALGKAFPPAARPLKADETPAPPANPIQ